MKFNANLDYFLFSLIVLGILFQTTILFIPQGLNSDAAISSLIAYDIISQGKVISFTTSSHTAKSLIFPISSITPLVLIFLIFGVVDWGVRVTILFYNLLSAFFLYKLTVLWFNEKTARVSLVLFLFSPWVMSHFNLGVPTGFLFTVMPIYIHQVALKDKKYLPLTYSLMGLSFYFLVTAKIVICFYLFLYFFFNQRRFFEKSNILSFILFILLILPWLFFNFPPSQREIILRPEPGFSLDLASDIVYPFFFFITPFLFVAFIYVFDVMKKIMCDKRFEFIPVFLSGWLLSVFAAIYLAPYVRPRVLYYSAPAFIILSSWFYSRVSRENIYIALSAFAISGIEIHATFALDKSAIMPVGSEYGLDKVTEYLMSRDDVGWIYTDYRMDKQILFYSQRKLPLKETAYPHLDEPTVPWSGHYPPVNIYHGCYYYCFWANLSELTYITFKDPLLDENQFLKMYNGSSPVYSVDYPWGDRAINVYRICND